MVADFLSPLEESGRRDTGRVWERARCFGCGLGGAANLTLMGEGRDAMSMVWEHWEETEGEHERESGRGGGEGE